MTSFEHVQYRGWTTYRPQPLWLPVGAVAGAGAGAAVGAGLLAATSLEDPGQLAEIGFFYGGMVGAVIGLVSGLVLTFAAGSHLDRRVARDRAFGVTALATAVPVLPGSLLFLFAPFPLVSLVLATLVICLAGALARWAAGAL